LEDVTWIVNKKKKKKTFKIIMAKNTWSNSSRVF
jgi:hypothetical protein